MRRISVKNHTDAEARITWKIKEDSIHVSPLYLNNATSVDFVLLHTQPHNKINFSAGVGLWDKKSLSNFVDDLEEVELQWSGGNIKLNSEEKIQNFLQIRRRGLGNRIIYLHFVKPSEKNTKRNQKDITSIKLSLSENR